MEELYMKDVFLEDTMGQCTRSEKLVEKDMIRETHKEMQRCMRRRNKPGFEVIDNMRYRSEE